MVPRPVARGKFRWERLAFFVWWSLNFHKFILFSSVAFLLKGRRGTKQRQGSQGWGRGRRGPPSRPAGLAFVCWGVGGGEVSPSGREENRDWRRKALSPGWGWPQRAGFGQHL